MAKPTAKDIVKLWLLEQAIDDVSEYEFDANMAPTTWTITISSWAFESQLPRFGYERFDKRHIGSTYNRRWRELRDNDARLLHAIGIVSITERENDNPWTEWVVKWSAAGVERTLSHLGDEEPLTFPDTPAPSLRA
jgi:hypothetical protein